MRRQRQRLGEVAMSQGAQGSRRLEGPSPRALEGAGPCRHLEFGLLASGTMRDKCLLFETASLVVLYCHKHREHTWCLDMLGLPQGPTGRPGSLLFSVCCAPTPGVH